jgi:carbon starvation protein CstA
MSIPLALFMGLYMYRFRKGRIAEATTIGVIGLLIAVILGKPVAASAIGPYLQLSREQLIIGDGRLRVRRVGAAGVAAALPARLSQLVHEDRHDRVSS